MSNINKRVQVNKIIESQLPEFITADFPKATEFLKQYYVSQEHQGGNVDIAENLDQYLKLDNLTPDVISGITSTTVNVTSTGTTINVGSTKGFPSDWGLLKIDDEIITYTGITTNSFTGCVRGFSGVTGYNSGISTSFTEVNKESLVFESSTAASHTTDTTVTNLSVLFLKEFYKKLKISLTPGLENNKFTDNLDVSNFIKSARAFYQSKGIAESIRILFTVLYGKHANVLDLESYLVKPSSADFIRREVLVVDLIDDDILTTPDPQKLVGQTVYKSNDSRTSGSVSEVEILEREGKSYYKISLFVGYNERDLIEGTFTIPGKTKVLEPVSVSDTIISVDSTVGFGNTGTIISDGTSIDYTSKSINQFFGCSNTPAITLGGDVRANEHIYGYENGDLTKPVKMRITGVLSKFVPIGNISLTDEKETITVRNIGEIIRNPSTDRTYKEVFANSWIYNTRSRYQVSTITNTALTLISEIDKSSLRDGDTVDVLLRNTNTQIVSGATVSVNKPVNQINLSNFAWPTGHPNLTLYEYDVRRNIKKASSSGASIADGNNKLISDILNVYTDGDDYGYAASNSLPSYQVSQKIIESSIADGSGSALDGYNNVTKLYSIISFPSPIEFVDGDLVVYKASNTALGGLINGQQYYIQKIGSNKIKLYASLGQLYSTANHIQFDIGAGSHTFTLKRHNSQTISARRILRKFPLKPNLNVKDDKDLAIEQTGILIDGVEITSPKSDDKIYYGHIGQFNVLNGGKDYDVLNPPLVSIAASTGTTALVEPIIEGTVKEILVDTQDFDVPYSKIPLNLTGGNGSGCLIEPIIGERFREIKFDSRDIFFGGGIDVSDETITFTTPHNLKNGEGIIYNQNGNDALGIGVYGVGAGEVGVNSLSSGDQYYIFVVNPSTVKLHKSQSDALANGIGINTIGISTATNPSGIHKFRTLSKRTIRSIKIIKPGSGYSYRKLRVPSSGVSTEFDRINYKNHGFNSGDNVKYSFEGTSISGLDTDFQYKVIKIDNNAFRLTNAGLAGTDFGNYSRNNYVDLATIGVGTHIFKYPDIVVGFGATTGIATLPFTFTPIVTGSITDSYLYEAGTGYGSTVLNLHKKPLVSLKNGKEAQLNPILVDGKIQAVQVLNKGYDYYSIPDIEIVGDGSGAIVRPVILNGKLDEIVVINPGIGYSTSNTNLYVTPKGSGALFEARVRDLTLNDTNRYGDYCLTDRNTTLTYSVYGYSQDLANKGSYESLNGTHSPIIGWAYDGNPIYGPYGYSDPSSIASRVSILKTGFSLDTASIVNRPTFPDGFFIEDYKFDNLGALDRHNGRFCKTPEFPNGTYAYFAGVTTSALNNNLIPSYPYFIGETYRSDLVEENLVLDHDFDFNSSNLSRNTYPYKVGEKYADNDFILESNEVLEQKSVIESVTKGEINSISVLDGGSAYRVGDITEFDNTNTNGTGLKGVVDELVGIGLSRIETSVETNENSVFVWKDQNTVEAYVSPYTEINDGDHIVVSGLTTSITYLDGTHKVGISTDVVSLGKTMTVSGTASGKVEDIYISDLPNNVSIGSSIKIGTEVLRVLNVYPLGDILRVRRFGVGIAHTFGTHVSFLNDKVTIPVKTTQFESKQQKKIYFNAHQSVGIGTTPGSGVSTSYTIGESYNDVFIPTRSLYIPNHPFVTGEKLTFSITDPVALPLTVGVHSVGLTFNLPNVTTKVDDAYVINKGKDYIGLTSTLVGTANTSEGLYFHGFGSDNSNYLLESTRNVVTGRIERIVSTLSAKVSAGNTEVHGLQNRDEIKLNIVPNTIVGLGTTAACNLHYDEDGEKILINPINITFSAISTTDTFTYTNHRFVTGDKIWYKTISGNTPVGLSNRSSYYVHKVTDNSFKLTPTRTDALLGKNIVRFVTAPTSVNRLSLINPPIEVVKNSSLQFGLSTSTLLGYDLKIFYDNEFKNEFKSVADSSDFNVVGFGTVGVSTNASLTLNYSKNLPSTLYYNLSKGGYISTADTDVHNYGEIKFVDSGYNGNYKVFGITTDTFKVSPRTLPEVLTYTDDQCDTLEYSTKSKNVRGSIKDIRLLSKGFNYKKVPKFVSVGSTAGINANLVAISTAVGQIKDVRIIDIGYEYPSDKTLRPEAFVSPVNRVDDLDTISSIEIPDGGKNFLNAPDLILYNPNTNEVIDTSSLIAEVPNSTISNVKQLAPINGLESVNHRLIAINNSNGVGIKTMYGGGEGGFSGVVTCILDTPVLGFGSAPFAIGDQMFVEGIEQYDSSSNLFGGSGYNSGDYNYNFFEVTSFLNSNPAELEFNLSGFTTNPGVAKTYQSGYATLVNRSVYPTLNVVQKRGSFVKNEQLFVDIGSGYIAENVYVTDAREDFVKTHGLYDLEKGYKIKGTVSGVTARVTSIITNKAKFEVDYSNKQEYGWLDNIGKLSEDIQRIPDNDYYQNLSYSVQSPITWDEFVDPVNRVVHPSGLKNFADTSVTSNVNVGVSYGATTRDIVILDVLNERRVDTINNFDQTIDYETKENKSKYIQFQNTKLTDYNKCKTNRVLLHDDISPRFSSKGNQDLFTEIQEIEDDYVRYLIQIIDPDTNEAQINDVVVSTTTNDAIIFEKSAAWTGTKLGEITAESDSFQRKTLVFTPEEKFDRDHDIKILKTDFNTDLPGIGTQSFGCIDLIGTNVGVGSTTVGFTTSTIVQFPTTDFNSLYANIQVQDNTTREINILDVLVDFDGTNTHIADYYFDTTSQATGIKVGVITAVYDSNAGIVSLTCENDRSNTLNIRTNAVGFGTTTVGLGTYRFSVSGQPIGAERSARLESIYNVGINTAEVYRGNLTNDTSLKSVVRVSCGNTSALHQVHLIHDKTDVYTTQFPFISVGGASTTGLGTFGGAIDGSDVVLNFYPDSTFTSNVEVQSFNEVFYTFNDFNNEPPPLTYGTVTQRLFLDSYDGVNGSRANKIDFNLKHEGVPIYTKRFTPSDTTQLNPVTGVFTLNDHFFNTGEELTYTPTSTFVGVGSTAIGIGQTADYWGNVVTKLPPFVYPVVINANQFKLVTRKEYATKPGTHVTFTNSTDANIGNAHILEMTKKLTKTVIGLDGIVQQPITYTTINHNLMGAIGAATSSFALTGISTVQPRDVLKIDDEYMKVVQVGFATSPTANIFVGTGTTFPIVKVDRGALGTGQTAHANATQVDVHRGSYNIIGSKIWFLDPPKGNTRDRRSETNLPYVRAEFSGRTFTRSDYSTNMLFDDISDDFTGIGKTYTMSVGGANTTGVGIGSGILFINGVFQTPITENNAGNNYQLEQDLTVGLSSAIFTGITSTDGSFIKSEFDINQNQLPRGGLIVSLGSTPGLGYAPLVGADVEAKLNASGEITSIVGVATTAAPRGISTAIYDNDTGILEITTSEAHGLLDGGLVKLEGMNFICEYGSKTYPYVGSLGFADKGLGISGILSATTFNVDVGFSTVTHTYQGQGAGSTVPNVIPYNLNNFGSGYRGPVAIGVTDLAFEHKFIRAAANCVTGTGGPFTPTDVSYESHSGVLSLTIPAHGRSSGNVQLINNSITFTCSRDDHETEHTYPRASDPAANGNNLPITVVGVNTISVNVGKGGGGGTGANITAKSAANDHTFIPGSSTLTNAIDIVGGGFITPDSVEYTPLTGILKVNKSGLSGLTIQTTKNISNSADGVVYDPVAGIATIKTTNAHGFSNGDKVKIEDYSIAFTCGLDANQSPHFYPRPSDPVSGKWLTATVVNTTKFSVDVGTSSNTTPHTFVTGTGSLTNAIRKSNSSVGITTGAFAFTCAQDNHATTHTYPRTSDPAFRTELPVGQVTANTSFEVFVGKAPAGTGGVLEFTISAPGTDYVNPQIDIPQPAYQNMPVVGISRLGAGHTTATGQNLLLNLGIEGSPLELVQDRFGDAADLIRENRQLIGEIAVGRMLDEYPGFQINSGQGGYNNQDCIDDIKDVLRSVEWNLRYGGNDRTVDTANLYVTDDHVTGEEQESIFAFKQAANLAVDVMRNKTLTSGAQYEHTFVSATATAVNPSTGSAFQPTGATYNPATGDLVVTKSSHGLTPPAAHTATTGTAYNPSTGVLTVVTSAAHGFSTGDKIIIKDGSLTFSCARDGHATNHSYPRGTDPFSKKWLTVTVTNATTFTCNVGISQDTSAHTFKFADSNGILKQTSTATIAQDSLTFTCDLDGNIAQKTYPRATDPAHNTALGISTTSATTFTVNVGASQTTYVTSLNIPQIYDGAITVDGSSVTPTNASYQSSTGVLTLTVANHGFTNGNLIKLVDNSITFTCDKDSNATEHTYPRATDPASNNYISIGNTTTNTFDVNVGQSPTIDITPSAVAYNPTTGIMEMTIGSHCYQPSTTISPTSAEYTPTTGILKVTSANHGLCTNSKIKIADGAFTFTCLQGGGNHAYPRATDPISNKWIPVTKVDANTFTIQVLDTVPSTNTTLHSFVSSVANSITKRADVVRIAPEALTFTCAADSHQTNHSYPRVGDPFYNQSLPIEAVTATTISVQVLASQPSTNTSAHTFVAADAGSVTIGHYDHTFVSASAGAVRRQSPAACANVASAIHTLVGIVTTGIGHTTVPQRTLSNPALSNVDRFEIARSGHSFSIGDKFQPVGLVTAQGLIRPRSDFELEVVETFNDYFSAWQFGQIDFIDTIKFMQDGGRRRFPLKYNGELLSFEKDDSDATSLEIDLNSVLLIFVNGVLQTPGYAYQFDGGATFTFTTAPKASDKIDIFFYTGATGIDTEQIDVLESVKPGDNVKIYKHPLHNNTTLDQERERVLVELRGSDIAETDTYTGVGITENTYKPMEWTKQKTDMVIKGDFVSKGRDTIKALVYPTAHIIQDVAPDATSIFVDDAQFFNYEFNNYNIAATTVDALIVDTNDPVSAAFTAIVSAAGTISSLDITNVGSGYTGNNIPISIASPGYISIGIGTTATATGTVANGSITSVSITNPGLGYTRSNVPNVLTKIPVNTTESVTNISNVQGFTGVVTGITTTNGIGGHPMALTFFFRSDSSDANDLTNTFNSENVSVVIHETRVGNGVTSVDSGDSAVVGISTTTLDNVYRVHAIQNDGPNGIITCNVHSATNLPTGFTTSSPGINNAGIATTPIGRISWGRIFNLDRGAAPVAIGITGLTYSKDSVGLSTYPTVQRRKFGLRNTGAIRKLSN